MNSSSGIKRGLAASAVAALAVAGIPALASSASATAGETITVASVGPTLNGGTGGGVVRLKASSTIVAGDVDGTDPLSAVALTNTNLNGSPNNGNQNVAIVGTPTWIANGAAGDSNTTDGLNEVLVHVAATTSDVGATAAYAIYVDDNGDGTVQASEARAQVSQQTSGPVSALDVTPASQSAALGIESGAYTVVYKDSAGRTTQPSVNTTFGATGPGTTTFNPAGPVTPASAELGTTSFKATGTVATGARTLTVTTGAISKTATLNVTPAASLTASEVDVVTGADTWNGFGGGAFGGAATEVRVDQTSVRIDIKSSNPANANATVTLNLDGHAGANQITFGGKPTTTVSTVLDANGVGSITITPDAFTIQENEVISISGTFAEDLTFERAAADAVVPSQNVYFSALKATTTVNAKVVDQFGNPITGGFVAGYRDATPPNADTPPGQVKPVGADGSVSFAFTDTNAVVGDQDTVTLAHVPDQFTNTPDAGGGALIKYTADGMGANFNTTLDTHDTGLPTYKASDTPVIPLTDANDGGGAEDIDIAVAGAENNQAITLSVDNGALILKPGQSTLAQGSASVSTTTTAGGALPAGYRIIGTKSGVGTLSISSAGRTETAQFTVSAQSDPTTARNVTVSGPAEVESGATQITYTAVITDAFGNSIANFGVNQLNIQVTGPAQFQDSDAVTNANGQINLNVRLDSDAQGDVTIKVTGLGNQFGAAANQEFVGAPANGAPGLTVSSNVATATSTVAAPEPGKVDPQLALSGKSASGKDKIKANAIPEAAGATATLWVGGVKKKTGTLNASGDFTFSIKDTNGSKPTKYLVKVSGTGLTTKAKASISQK